MPERLKAHFWIAKILDKILIFEEKNDFSWHFTNNFINALKKTPNLRTRKTAF